MHATLFGLIRTPALVYFFLSGVLMWLIINLISIVIKPLQFILSKIVHGGANMPGSGIAVFGIAVFIYRTMYRSSLSVFTTFFPYQIMVPYPIPARIFLEKTNYTTTSLGSFFPININFPIDYLQGFHQEIDLFEVAFTLSSIPIQYIDLMILWVIVLACYGYLLSKLVKYILFMADLH
tara:strand:- start:546 stop:1082 length:537 start_codon:yes stop_codon:yes gene_type:complete